MATWKPERRSALLRTCSPTPAGLVHRCRNLDESHLLYGQAITKPYGYSLFNLDAFAIACQSLSTPADSLWTFELPDGRGIKKALAFMFPYIADKTRWPHKPDVQYHENWPVRHPSLLFGGLALGRPDYIQFWRTLEADPTVEEVIRNFVVRQPLLWIATV